MVYKAIIFDLDGTAIPNKKDGLPSKKLIDLVEKLKNNISVSAATGRQIFTSRPILKSLGLVSPCIILGGTQIIDPRTEEVLWEKVIQVEAVKEIISKLEPFDYELFLTNEIKSSPASEKIIEKPEHVVYIMTVSKPRADLLIDRLSVIPNIAAHLVPSNLEGYFDIHITHSEATKKHALDLLLQMLKVKKEEVIGFGDGDNDLPIFEAVGYKVAMSNASPELKNLADLIAPSAEDDGVAKVLEELVV